MKQPRRSKQSASKMGAVSETPGDCRQRGTASRLRGWPSAARQGVLDAFANVLLRGEVATCDHLQRPDVRNPLRVEHEGVRHVEITAVTPVTAPRVADDEDLALVVEAAAQHRVAAQRALAGAGHA